MVTSIWCNGMHFDAFPVNSVAPLFRPSVKRRGGFHSESNDVLVSTRIQVRIISRYRVGWYLMSRFENQALNEMEETEGSVCTAIIPIIYQSFCFDVFSSVFFMLRQAKPPDYSSVFLEKAMLKKRKMSREVVWTRDLRLVSSFSLSFIFSKGLLRVRWTE